MKTSGISSESGERNKITEVLLRWAGKTELFPGGLAARRGCLGAVVNSLLNALPEGARGSNIK